MAESASDDSCEAPKDFQLSSIEGSESRFSVAHRKCLLCFNFRKAFTCKQCIQAGEVVHSTAHYTERLADKQSRLADVKNECKIIEESCNELLKERTRKNSLFLEINRCKENIQLLKLAIQQKKDNVKNNVIKLKSLKDFNHQVTAKLPKYKEKIEKVCKHVHHKKAILERHGNQIELEQESLKILRRQRLRQIVDYVFPITEIKNSHSMGSGSIGCTERAIAEASRPTEGGQTLPQLQILSALLPLDLQDYNAYCHWVAENKCMINTSGGQQCTPEPVKLNPAYRISAMLAYCAQLLQIMAFYLDVRLPYNISYSDVCSSELEERAYRIKVWRVQACAVAVCEGANIGGPGGQHHIEPPLHTLLRACPLNINGVVCEDIYQVMYSGGGGWLEREWAGWWGVGGPSGHDDIPGMCTDEEETEPPEHLHWDWDTLGEQPRSPPPPVPTQVLPTAQGLVTSAAASIASIWRGWTNK